jgi:alkyldihydroxyacetonephosphate synthase
VSAARPSWWGWGVADRVPPFPEALASLAGPPTPAVALEAVRLPESRLPAAVREAGARTDRQDRIRHAAGKSYPDLIRIRSGDASNAPDGVLYPADHDEVARLLELCSAEGVAVVPFGGGTSVVGGVEPLRGQFEAVVALDLERLDGLTTDRTSLTGTFGAGLRGPQAETRLAARGLTLGHFPQSFEFATIGGYAATRSAGQASTGYGRFDKLVLGLRAATPAGDVEVKPFPGTAAGPSLRELFVGSEGALGVITEATLALRPFPEERRYEGWSFRSFDAGVEAFRQLAHAHAAPDVARLSDHDETRLAMTLSASGSLTERLGKRYLSARGHAGGCIVIAGYEGEPDDVAWRARAGALRLRAAGGLSLGRRPGESWLRSRYHGPYLRDALLGRGVMVETLETASSWTRLRELHTGVADALRESMAARGTPALVGAHVSHVYASGASLYFTWIARREVGAELEQWRAAKGAAMEAILAHGGTITHHHAVGRDHAPWMAAEVGETGVEALRALKERLDPAGIMNPGKLLPPA